MNRLENPTGYATYDDNILEFVITESPLDRLPKSMAKLIKIQQAMQLNPDGPRLATGGSSRSMRLANIASVTMQMGDQLSAAQKTLARLGGGGWSNEDLNFVGYIDVSTTVAGSSAKRPIARIRRASGLDETVYDSPTDGFKIPIMGTQIEEAKLFFEGLKAAVGNANRVTVVGAAVSSGPLKECPDCAEDVKLAARKCKHCGYAFTEEEMEASRAELAAKEVATPEVVSTPTPPDTAQETAASPAPTPPDAEPGPDRGAAVSASTKGPESPSAKRGSPQRGMRFWIIVGLSSAVLLVLMVSLFTAMNSQSSQSTVTTEAASSSPTETQAAPAPQAASQQANTDAGAGSGLALSDEQMAEGYTLSSDGLVAWRYFNADEVATIPCGASEDSNDMCAVRHIYVVSSTACRYINVLFQGDGSMNSVSPGENGAPVELHSMNSVDDTVTTVSCQKS